MEQIKAFFGKINTEVSLQEQMKSLAERNAGIEDIIALANEHGFAFTEGEWADFAQKNAPAGELMDEQLVDVAGGKVENKSLYIFCSIMSAGIGCVVVTTYSLATNNDPGCI